MKILLLLFIFFFFSAAALASSAKEKTINFAAVYTLQWAYYLTFQRDDIDKYGSFDNWKNYPFQPHYDHDSFHYNLVRHTIAGQYYYLFYRSREYTQPQAFAWTALSSLAYEFTIETFTERPSYQDIFLTPLFGTTVGVGIENLSAWLHTTDTWIGHTLGYILNPFTLLPPTSDIFGTIIIHDRQISAAICVEF